MGKLDGAHLSVSIYPEPGYRRTAEDVRELLLERGARPAGDDHFIERRRRMRLDRTDAGVVEIVMSAGPLDGPDSSRRETDTFTRYLLGLLVAVTERTRPLYGGVGVEVPLATPGRLRDGVPAWPYINDPIFVRHDLLSRSGLDTVLTAEFGTMIRGSAGTVFTSRSPSAGPRGDWPGGRLLGRVASRHITEQSRR